MVENVRAGGGWDLTSEERALLLVFLYVQLKRCPDFFRGLPLDEPMQDVAERTLAESETVYSPISPEDRERHLSPDNLASIERFARMGALLDLSPKILDALDGRGLAIAWIPRPDRRFILASLPVVRFMSPSGRRDLGDPAVELWLPIAPDVAIASAGAAHLNQVVHLTHDASIRKVNGELARMSNTSELLQSLTRRMPPAA